MPEGVAIFVDRSLGSGAVPAALRAAGEIVVVHDDLFAEDTPDDVWLSEAGRRGWIAVSKDIARARSHLQRVVVAESGAMLFVLRSTEPLSGVALGEVLVRAAPRMRVMAEQIEAPFVARVYKSGDVRLWYDSAQLSADLHRYRESSA